MNGIAEVLTSPERLSIWMLCANVMIKGKKSSTNTNGKKLLIVSRITVSIVSDQMTKVQLQV